MVIVISDIHLGDLYCKISKFELFLANLFQDIGRGNLPQLKTLIILGDTFDIIMNTFRNLCNNPEFKRIYDLLYTIKNQGVYIVFVLGNHEIPTTPKSIFKMDHLRTLYLPMNNIQKVPSELNNLKQLRNFDISNNPIKQLEIGSEFLKKLERFWIDKSQIFLFKEIFKDLKDSNVPLGSKNIEIDGFSPYEVDQFFRKL